MYITIFKNKNLTPISNLYYPAKILLFGEYTIIKGGQALAMPLSLYNGKWDFVGEAQDRLELQQNLFGLCQYLENLEGSKKLFAPINLTSFRRDLQNGLYFDSSIPGGYGAGSSGALCAAIYDRYSTTRTGNDLVKLRKELAQIESFFHGSSSGTDPLISYLNTAVHIFSAEHLEKVNLPKQSSDAPVFFLLDTGQSRQTAPLVNLFLEKCTVQNFEQESLPILIELNNAAINYFLNGNWEALEKYFQRISDLQFESFAEMIPEAFQNVWKKGLLKKEFYLKLCGAGGGGFILGMTKEWAIVEQLFGDGVQILPIFFH